MDTSLNPLIILFLFFIGSVFGSFLNVVIYRVPKKMSIVFPSSHCFNCKKNIPLKYNIPIIGYFLLKGKCVNCSKSFPSRYAFVELITAILTIIIYLIFDISPLFLYTLYSPTF